MKDHEFRELVNALRDVALVYHDHESLRERIRHALSDALKQQAPSVPDGWQLVPKVPTLEMLCALIDGANQYDSWNEGYRDMIAAAPQPERSTLNHDAATAYGFLWHVNNEPGTPNRYSPERAAYGARKILREHLSAEERGDGINRARELMKRSACDEREGE